MTIKSVAIDIGILLAVAAAAGGAGYVRGHVDGVQSSNRLVVAAQRDQLAERERTNVAVTALDDLKRRLDIQKQTLLGAQAAARVALDALVATKKQLDDATRQRIAAERKAAHESPDCSNLEHLPVCPVLARRLFSAPPPAQPAAAGAGATQGH